MSLSCRASRFPYIAANMTITNNKEPSVLPLNEPRMVERGAGFEPTFPSLSLYVAEMYPLRERCQAIRRHVSVTHTTTITLA